MEYPTLGEAISAATAGDSIVLLQDIALAASQTIEKNLKLNLDGHTISGSAQKLINITAGDVTIKNGNITSTQWYAIEQAGTGTLTLTDCEVSGNARVVYVEAGTVNANSSVISSTGNATVYNKGTFNASNCTIRASGTGTTIMNSTAVSAYFENCAISTEGSTAVSNGSTSIVNINGGTVTSKCGSGFTINTSRGTVNIYGDVVITTCCRAIKANVGSPAYTDANPPAVVVNFGGYEEGGHLVASGHPRIVVRDDDTPTGADLSVVSVYYKNGVVNIFGDASIKATNTNVQSAISVWNGGSVEITGGSIEANSTVVRAGKLVGDSTGFPVVTNNIEISDSAQLVSSTDGTTIVVLNEDVYPSEVEIWGGVFTDDVSGDKCRDGYAAFPNGTVPETYTVASSYTVYYNANNGTTEQGTVYVRQTEPAYTVAGNSFANGSFIFNGWNTKADGTGDTYAPDATMTLTQDTTLYAQWRGVAKIGDTHYTTLNAAAAAVSVGTPTTITILQNLNFYDIAGGNLTDKTITFTGAATDTLTLTNAAHEQTAADRADLTFENITLKNDNTADAYRGIIHADKVTINNCEILGFMMGYAKQFNCNNCTFTASCKFHMWTYGSNCKFDNCTFNSSFNSSTESGKAVNVYTDQTYDQRVIVFNDCEFNASNHSGNGSAIQINSQFTCFVIYVNNCTVTGYSNTEATAVPGYENLANNKASSTKTTLYIDGVQLLKQGSCDPVAKIGDTYYTTLQDALDAAYGMTGDVTVNLIRNTAEDVTISQKVGLNYTINGNNDTLNGRIFVDGKRLYPSNDPGEVIITNMNFTFNDALSYGGATKGFVCNSTNNNSYAAHVTVSHCTFDGGGASNGMAAFRAPSGASIWDVTLDNLVVVNCHSLAQLTGTTGATITNDTVTYSENFVNISGGSGNFDFSNCYFNGTGYAARLVDQSSAEANLSNNNFISSDRVLMLGKNNTYNPSGHINVVSGTYNGQISKETVAGSTAAFVFTGGTFNQDSATVAKWCAEGYCAVPNDPSAGLVTVRKMYQVTYDANGGTGTPMTPSYVRPFAGTTFEVKDNEGYAYGAANFTGWNTKADGTGDPYAAGATMAIESDTTLYAQWGYVAMIGTTPYATLQAAVDSANKNMTGDVTIDLMKNTSEVVTVLQKAENNLTINGNGNTLTGQMFISSNQEGDIWNGTDKINITNLKFAYDENYFNLEGSTDYWKTDGFIVFCRNCFFTSNLNYAHNVTISDCEFDGAGSTQKIYAVKSGASGGVNKVVLENCTAKNVLGLAELQSTANFTVTGCTATENVDRGLYIAGSVGNHHITNNTITATEYAVHIQYQTTTGTTDSLSGNTFEAPVVFKLDHNESPNVTLDITSGTYKGTINDQDASTIFNITGGTYSEDVTGEPCAPGYAAFDNHDGTWTVAQAWFLYYDKNEAGASGTMDTLFVKQSGTVAERTLVVDNCNFTWLPDHSFLAWNTKANALGDTLRPGDNIILSSDTTLYVIWQEGYTIFYDNNGGVGTIPNQYKAVDETITLSDGTDGAGNYLITKTDSTLYRWNTAADEGGDNYALGAEYSANTNVTMYAVWRLNLNMTMDSTDVVCYGQNNGTDTVKIIGGEAPYKLVLSGGALTDNVEVTTDQTTYIFTDLKPSANAYKVQLTDVLTKDTIYGTFTISQPDTLEITALTIPEGKQCPLMGTGHFDVSVTAQGGNVGAYHYTWSGDVTDADNDATEVPALADDRDYKYVVDVTVTDSKSCTATATDTIRISPVIAHDETTHSNTTMTIAAINKTIIHGCDTIIRDFGTPVFVFTNPDITEDILDTVYNNVSTVAPDSVFSIGTTVITWTAVDTCGHSVTATQDVVIGFMPCPTAIDANGNEYQTVRVGCYCWMAENLRATVYSDGSSRAIPNVMHYTAPTRAIDPNGNLYDWYATMDAGEGGTNTVSDIETQYAAGESVQGACPAGWHVPTEAEVENLMSSMSTEDLMAQGLWLPDVGTNASGFNLLPSGCYNSELDRYERKSVGAYFWILTPPSAIYHACEFGAACSTMEIIPGSLKMGFSVRCVKD